MTGTPDGAASVTRSEMPQSVEEMPPVQPPAPAQKPPAGRPLFRELITITLGVLIALSFENLVQWGHDRALVRQARATITRSDLMLEEQLARRLLEVYDRVLKRATKGNDP
jgi:hypothetical protein